MSQREVAVEPLRFGFGIQPDKEGRFVLYRFGVELARYPSAHAAANAAFLIMEGTLFELRSAKREPS